MRRLTERGVTLAELIVALALSTVILAGACLVMLVVDRSYRRSIERIGAHQSLRAAASILPSELRQLDPADSDLGALSPTSITLRRFREFGALCALASSNDGQLVVTVRELTVLFGSPGSFAAGDSVLVFQDGDRSIGSDDRWGRAQITKTASGTCPGDSLPAQAPTIELHLTTADSALRHATLGAPIRAFTATTYTLYQSPSDRRWYLGMRADGSTIEPLVGPLKGADGVVFTYSDSSGKPTATVGAVTAVDVLIRGSPLVAQDGRSTYDSIALRVAVRGRHS
ncbi:MAG TPA: hypothetical protein VLT79_07795 [Gemmatimonadales bacterium]|nr:hypothetical protein [Gemmatimonadales bacterium]